jgi:hypothetical protein
MEKLGDRKVSELEKLSTALFVTKQKGMNTSDMECANEIHDIKPHISVAVALDASRKMNSIKEETKYL